MRPAEFHRILKEVRSNRPCTHLTIKVDYIEGTDHCYLQVVGEVPDIATDSVTNQKGRKWLLSSHMTDGEVVQTAFMALLAWQEHELREYFTYKGFSIFNPHYDIDKLVEFRSSNPIKERS